ncbi:uncharacterized protein LOC131154975 [Malania oleifera]|uniref:uncharacterized protein LOC131154975 n=1 Tax=Malania oleifera TaxID=397392 RepID=UPI0025ADEA5A|nr:uncharacterized protein LOC131154975 [Malania oleifera]
MKPNLSVKSMLQCQNLLSSTFCFSLPSSQIPPTLSSSSPTPLTFLHRPTSLHSLSALPRTTPQPWLAQVPEPTASAPEAADGPIELPPSTPSIFAPFDNPSPIQVASSLLLTGAISFFLFRSLRRRAKRAKELRFRSSGAEKTLKEEALDSLKTIRPPSLDARSPPSPVQALLGSLTAGVMTLILYKFATTVEASLNRQTMSDNLSVRQLTITIRTIVNGMCYLATFVFGINSVGLLLYATQLVIKSILGISTSEDEQQSGFSNSGDNNSTKGTELKDSEIKQSSDDTQ